MAKTKQANRTESDDSKDLKSLRTVLFYCSLIVFFPILTFFLLKSFVLDFITNLSQVQSNIYSAVAAVIALHIALGIYIYRAYFQSEKEAAKKRE